MARRPDAGLVRRVLSEHSPGRKARSIRLLGAGLDNAAFLVDDELVVRFHTDAPELVEREARLLALVAGRVSIPVPQPEIVDVERGCLAYPKLPGTPLIELADRPVPVAAALGELIAVLRAIPADELTGLVDIDDTSLDEWLIEAAAGYRHVRRELPLGQQLAIERFLDGEPPEAAEDPEFAHNDLGIEHVLVDPARPETVTGVIDWTDAAITDPACDLGRIHRDLGPAALAAAMEASGLADGATRTRAEFYARCGLLEDMAYGLRTGHLAHVAKSLDGLAWLFPSST